ncbi:hypothetical protein [Methanocella arvoryzae]|uniref:Uncharacterized protein n=1 Tax=Methanocella arvoryzae (strain DSM 22066 / NBRC 105507 / MRE50) TaxID=351160 RepID=Q0W560_METAR|nr:hypothetical protein [Methanocella arvoryzae]CAJ36483.1 hypothetical protein RCIX1165 [Methanocella arvoryzae MRE50]
MLDETLILILAAGTACVVFFAGLCMVAGSLYLFLKQRSRTAGGVPAWMLVLAVGLFLTFVVPGAIIFLAAYVIATQTPPPVVTCYAPKPPEVTDYTSAASSVTMAVPLAMRLELAEKLRESGKLPGHIYDKIKK